MIHISFEILNEILRYSSKRKITKADKSASGVRFVKCIFCLFVNSVYRWVKEE